MYNVNKSRSTEYAERTRQAITWVPARDRPLPDTLKQKPTVASEKLKWLQRHDKNCGALCSMFPLERGMRVILQDHLDQNPKKQLLRGRVGYLEDWVLHAEETSRFENGQRILKRPPKVVFVRFRELVGAGAAAQWEDCKWVVGDLPPGVYPVRPWKRTWYLGQERKVPMLGVSREQLPLAPTFATTAHAS